VKELLVPTRSPYDPGVIERIAKVIGDTDRGLKGGQIGELLVTNGLEDPGEITKWRRIHEALTYEQQRTSSGNCVLTFVRAAMTPVRWEDQHQFEELRGALNVVLAFIGLELRKDGQLAEVVAATTHDEVDARTRRLRRELERRRCHAEVFKYCTRELLEEDCFTAVFEAVKGLATRTRGLAGVDEDGHRLVDAALTGSSPLLAINSLRTDTEQNEQRGLAHLMKGIFSAFRNPAAHEPRTAWSLSEADAMDLFATLSLVHRRLDGAVRVPQHPSSGMTAT
jgi:uncharacterized protein (TIGR02391 family)